MTIEVKSQESEDGLELNLIGELNINSASETKDQLLSPILNHKKISIDLSQISDIDTAGVQLLIMIKKEATKLGIPLNMTAHSGPVINALEVFGLVSFFGDPIVLTK